MLKIVYPKLYEWQQLVFEDIKNNLFDFYVIKAKRQIGKSVLSIGTVLYFSFNQERSISVIIEPTLHQSRRVYKQLINAVGGEGSPAIKSANATLLTIEFINGSEVVFKSAEQKEALRGMTVKRGILVIDEAAYIPDDIFNIVYPVVDANKCPVLLISTPLFQTGEFYNKYVEGLSSTVVKSYDWSTYDTSVFLSAEKLEYYRRTVPPLKFLSEYLGQFITEGSYVFGNLNNLTEFSTNPSAYGGVDWAASQSNDSDETTMTLMDEQGRITEILSYKNLSPTEQIERLAEDINKRHLKCVQVESNSIGEVYYDMLFRKLNNTRVVKFWTSNDSKRRIIEQLISAVQSGALPIVNEPILLRQMQHFEIQRTKTGAVTYNNDSNTVHDDRVISLAFVYDLYLNNKSNFSISFV